MFHGYFAWQVREELLFKEDFLAEFTPESNIAAFAKLFLSVCFDDNNESLPHHLVKDARQLIERCRAEDPKSRPTMENVVKEMETWNLT
ncbi:hypothetical protein M378DRAFT_10768 [Amanita muscaria Koide BX008]|uniref:Serine-threonine/tyrosine-protein kinase catalytic domain-containing protein n=1 Tax=Amanita muscaria (strain Koide BX008) TaxID=946122 RepID=A0A0C2SQ28_AMAMK|nr:hypothetical protein M378DRAFT_10768 [Amanita muscaria Koide BX008]